MFIFSADDAFRALTKLFAKTSCSKKEDVTLIRFTIYQLLHVNGLLSVNCEICYSKFKRIGFLTEK